MAKRMRGRPTRLQNIPPPRKPERDPAYKRRLRRHADMGFLAGFLGPVRGPQSFPEELVESLQASFMFDGFPGLEDAYHVVAQTLREHAIDPFGAEGQYVLDEIRNAMQHEMFGDYDRWLPCAGCREEFAPQEALVDINTSLLLKGWFCPKCQRGKRRSTNS